MRPGLDAATLALYTSFHYQDHYRFRVANGSGSMVDMHPRLTSIDLTFPSPDSPIGSMQVSILREVKYDGTDSIAPTVTASLLNRLNDGVTYAPLFELSRLVTLEVALTAIGGARPDDNSPLWYEIFRGNVAKVSWPKASRPAVATVRCNDLCGLLQDIKSETPYTYPAGMAVEDAMRQVLNNNGCTWMPTYVPVATGKVLGVAYTPGIQKTVWDQVWSLAQSIGWVCWLRYKADGTAALVLFNPPRDKMTTDLTLTNVFDVTTADVDKEQIRNVGYVQYSDQTGARKTVGPMVDGASIAQYGNIRRPFWISFAADSPVRSEDDATGALSDALSDVAFPDFTKSITVPAMPFLECSYDLYALPGSPMFGPDDNVAPYSATLSVKANEDSTSSLNVRESASAGYKTWRRMAAQVNQEIISATPSLDANGILRFTVDLPPAIVRWRTWSRLGVSPLIDGNPGVAYLKGPPSEGAETTQVAWAVQNGTHYIVTRAYAADGAFQQVETTFNVVGVGSGPGSGEGTGTANKPDVVPSIPFLLPSDGIGGTSQLLQAAWTNVGTSSTWFVEAEWAVNGVVGVATDTVDPTADLIGSVERSFGGGNTVKVRVRYVNKSVIPSVTGEFGLFSNEILVPG